MSWIITGTQRYQPAALLDQFPGAAAAYSLRNLVGTSNPSVVRVRRDNDDAEQDFTATEVSDGTLAEWVGAGNNGFVRTWYDQSGNNRHAFNTTTSTQPRIVLNGSIELESGKACLRFFSGAVLDTGFTGLVEKSLFAVAKLDSPTSSGRLLTSFTGSGGVGTELLADRGVSSFRLFDGGVSVTCSLTTGRKVLYASRSATLLSVGVNSAALTQASISNTAANTRNYAIGEDIPAVFIEYPDSIQEIVLYPSDQLVNRISIEANINAHYSIF